MTNQPLSTLARRALIALMLRPDPATNRILQDEFGFKIGATERVELENQGLITCTRGAHNAYVHQLKEGGLMRCRAALAAEARDNSRPADRLFLATGQLLADVLPRSQHELRSLQQAPPILPIQILSAYNELAKRPGGPVGLEHLRNRLAADRKDVDQALIELDEHDEIQLESDPDRAGLTPEARKAAIDLGGQPRHLVRTR
jgi:hypothetical protein